jgi:Flp pilus assembly protein TadG
VRAVRRPSRRRGQAVTELALVAPLLALLLVGGAQVGAIVYAQVTIDTAAREGARVGSEQPNNSGAYSGGQPAATPVACSTTQTPSNPVCQAVWNASGLLDGRSSFTVSVAPQTFPPPTASYSPPACPNGSAADGYVTVTVSYNAPVFVPLLDRLFSTSPGVHTVTATVRDRVEPCTLTNGQ